MQLRRKFVVDTVQVQWNFRIVVAYIVWAMNLWRCNIGGVIEVQIWAIISQVTGVGHQKTHCTYTTRVSNLVVAKGQSIVNVSHFQGVVDSV